jgi:hypothetical protein
VVGDSPKPPRPSTRSGVVKDRLAQPSGGGVFATSRSLPPLPLRLRSGAERVGVRGDCANLRAPHRRATLIQLRLSGRAAKALYPSPS